MKRFWRAAALLALVGFASGAALAQSLGEGGPGGEPALVPGTNVAWPKDDQACDDAWQNDQFAAAKTSCLLALDEYAATLAVLAAQDGVKPATLLDMTFNEGYTDMEVAGALKGLNDSKGALRYAQAAAVIAHGLLDPINAKKVGDETALDAHLKALSEKLLDTVHARFPAVPGTSADEQDI